MTLKLDTLRSTGSAGACVVREVKLSLEHRSWLNRRVCIMDLSDVSRPMGVLGWIHRRERVSAVRIDYKSHVLELEK